MNIEGKLIPIMVGDIETISKGLLKGLEDLQIRDQWRSSRLYDY